MNDHRSRDELVADIGSRLARDGAVYGFTIALYLASEHDNGLPGDALWVDIDGTTTSGFGANSFGGDGEAEVQADMAAWVQDNVFDDMRISSWPECPTHHGEHMSPWTFPRDPEPYWVCLKASIRIPIGSHPGPAPR
jgi:hypothetical protein